MYNPIEEKRRFVQFQIQKSFDSGINVIEEIELEKAHKDGDHHPSKPWVWVSSANGGKGDWRVEGGRAHKKAGAGTATSATGNKVDITKIPDAEFKRITQTLEKKNPDHTDAERYLEEEAMSDKELKNFYAVAEHFKNSSKINKLTQEYCRKWAELARQELQSRKKNNNGGSLSFSDFKLLPLGTVVSGGGYELKKDSKNRWVSLSNGKSSGATKNDEDAFRLQEFDDFNLDRNKNNNPAPRKPGSTDEIERMTPTAVHNAILGLNNTGTNVKDKGDHFLIEFDHNDFTTHGQRSPQIDRIAKFLESMGASCVIGKNEIKAYKKVEAKKYSNMDIKDAKKALVGKVVTLKDYWSDGRGGSQDAVGEIKNVRLYGKDKLPIAEISYPNGDEQLIRLDEIDDGKMKDSYKTPIVVGDDKTHLDAVKKKIANQSGATSDPRDKIAQDAGFKDYEEMRGYQDYVTQKNLLKKRSTSASMRLLHQKEVEKYEKDHGDVIKRIRKK